MRATLKDVHRCHRLVRKAVQSGVLARPDVCQKCGEAPRKGLVDAHHHRGYDEQHTLDVQWLCRACHLRANHKAPTRFSGERIQVCIRLSDDLHAWLIDQANKGGRSVNKEINHKLMKLKEAKEAEEKPHR
jgi:hypothetical protein